MDDAVNSSHAYWRSRSTTGSADAPSTGQSNGSVPGFTLGMSSFNEQERRRFGQSLKLSMAMIEGKASATPTSGKALPDDAPSIAQRLKSLSLDITSNLADQLELLARFDTLKGWERGGAKSCALWMNLELGIGLQLAREYLRVGRELRDLPVVTALFRAGKLTWSKVHLLTRVADAAVLMAENNLQSAGRDIATADRYQVIVSVDAAELSHGVEPASGPTTTPAKRATILGASSVTSPLAQDTARRLACDCSTSTIITDKGELMDIAQKTRVWPAAMARTICARGKSCVWTGCTQKQHLQIHHIKHWADGGATSMENAVCKWISNREGSRQ